MPSRAPRIKTSRENLHSCLGVRGDAESSSRAACIHFQVHRWLESARVLAASSTFLSHVIICFLSLTFVAAQRLSFYSAVFCPFISPLFFLSSPLRSSSSSSLFAFVSSPLPVSTFRRLAIKIGRKEGAATTTITSSNKVAR